MIVEFFSNDIFNNCNVTKYIFSIDTFWLNILPIISQMGTLCVFLFVGKKIT